MIKDAKDLGAINAGGGSGKEIYLSLSDADSFPYNLTEYGTGFAAANLDSSNDMVVTLTYTEGGTISITVPPEYQFDDNFSEFNTINVTGSTSFLLAVKR